MQTELIRKWLDLWHERALGDQRCSQHQALPGDRFVPRDLSELSQSMWGANRGHCGVLECGRWTRRLWADGPRWTYIVGVEVAGLEDGELRERP
jgi:hypothetical protein